MKKQLSLFGAVITIVVVFISVALVVVHEPERLFLESDDGMVAVRGFVREARDVTITATDVSGQYDVAPAMQVFDQPLVVQFSVPVDVVQPAVYRYDAALRMWEELAHVVVNDHVQVVVTSLGPFWVREHIAIDAPVFADAKETLMQMAPLDVVGYELFLAAAIDDMTLQLSNGYTIAWCDDRVQPVDTMSYSQLERTARVYVNDVEQEVTFLLVAKWLESENGDCSEDNAFPSVSSVLE